MSEGADRASRAVSVPMDSGAGMSASMGVAAPIGAVSRRNRERAARTSLRREGPAGVLLLTALQGTVTLQRRAPDGTWESVTRRRASRLGRTRLELPRGAAQSPETFRVVFSPRNSHITSWVSEDLGG